MKARIEFTNEHGETTMENVRWTDEIAEAEGMTEAEAARMEEQLRSPGRYWLSVNRCAYRA